MTVEEIFTKLATHMVEGIMIHDGMAIVYDFLALDGYRECHDYHHFAETKNYRCLYHYYMEHYHKLLNVENIPNPKIVPTSWMKYARPEVDTGTKRNAVRDMMKRWIDWEKETKTLLQTSYKELIELGEVAAAKKISCFLCDVDEELKHAEYKWIKLENLNYDLGYIMGKQEHMKKKYSALKRALFDK